ncbi:hypothetical protein MJA45_26605 [Paenibacillus aurantius]|uniref:DUF5668 domain-containing protein n=1 Tax=Paenibacillus aurantius TaxID=2918900 RepID=A0AA96RFD7_9BACL|nr:hypothetical protein [Paenibacillus aurantius]WJH35834.1 hypothetical protein N6H14_07900 [Paenibacillus sp. CC-CFT747]WNQ11128.1 hypothetical protein MJA45_26605 [Paenibacillus aurantius]
MTLNKNSGFGILFLLLGAVLLSTKFGFLEGFSLLDSGTIISLFWASIFILPLGIGFHLLYFLTGRKYPGLFIPGGILLVVAAVCQLSTLFDAWGTLWPGFPMAVAFGLLEFYLFGGRNKYILIPVFILGSISVIFFSIFSVGTLFQLHIGRVNAAILFLFIGAILLLDRKPRRA